MAESYEKAFDMYVGVRDPQKLNSFWTAQLQGSPYLGGRPELLQQIQQGSRPLPMALHGDGVSVTGLGKTWQKGIDAYSISSILTFGDTDPCLSNLYVKRSGLYSSGSACTFPAATEAMDRFYRALKWSFEALATGRWPRSDYMGRRYPRGSWGAQRAGKRLAQKHTAVLFCCKGDLDHFCHGRACRLPAFTADRRVPTAMQIGTRVLGGISVLRPGGGSSPDPTRIGWSLSGSVRIGCTASTWAPTLTSWLRCWP